MLFDLSVSRLTHELELSMASQLCDPSELATACKAVDEALGGERQLTLGARLALGLSIIVNVFRDLDSAAAKAEILAEVGRVLTNAAATDLGVARRGIATPDHIEMLRRAA